jgi:hypothetical protein
MAALGDVTRLAGTAMKEFFGRPAVRSALGKTAATAGAEQLIPRVLGQQPARSVAGSIARGGLEAAVSTPIELGLRTAGVHPALAGLGGALIAAPVTNVISQAIAPEPQHSFQTPYNQLAQMQQMQAAAEQQRYNNEINLALAKNYSAPTQIIHKNPSADLQTMYNVVSGTVPQYG